MLRFYSPSISYGLRVWGTQVRFDGLVSFRRTAAQTVTTVSPVNSGETNRSTVPANLTQGRAGFPANKQNHEQISVTGREVKPANAVNMGAIAT